MRIFTSIVIVFLLSVNGHAQLFDKNSDRQNNNTTPQTQMKQTESPLLRTAIQDGPVDPKEYIVGPGDVFSVNIWAAAPINFQVPVTPEGTVIIPTVGEFNISGKTLEEAKTLALQEIKKKYLSGISSFTLLQPRTFSVTLRGAVKNEMTFYVQSTQRVDAVVNYLDEKGKRDSLIAQRNIIILHKNGTTSSADLEKYYATLNTLYNPLLRDGDVVIAPKKNIKSDFFGVYGAVNKEGQYEYAEGDSLLIAIKIARGTTSLADSDNIVITRIDSLQQTTTFHVSLRKIINGSEPNFILHRGDRITVYPIYINNRDAKVEIHGEVKFPGFYPITKDSTYLSEVIALAGGFTERASLNNSQLFRRSVNPSDISIERLESGRGGLTSEDSAYYYLETDIRINRELVVADFYDLFQNKNTAKDILLRDGDYINIAVKKKTVYVFGQVITPGHILFAEGKDYKYYIQKAGGLTDDARSGDIKIIKASTRQWVDPGKTTIEEGDYVWIPKEPYRTFAYYLDVYSKVFGILGTVATLYLLIR